MCSGQYYHYHNYGRLYSPRGYAINNHGCTHVSKSYKYPICFHNIQLYVSCRNLLLSVNISTQLVAMDMETNIHKNPFISSGIYYYIHQSHITCCVQNNFSSLIISRLGMIILGFPTLWKIRKIIVILLVIAYIPKYSDFMCTACAGN